MRWTVARALWLAGILTVALPSASSLAKDAPVVTYSGLKFGSNGAASLRVELSSSAPVVLKQEGKVTQFLIDGATVKRRNNLNPLDASFFCSTLLRAKLDRKKEGVYVSLELREAAPVSHRLTPVGSGALIEFSVPPREGSSAGCK